MKHFIVILLCIGASVTHAQEQSVSMDDSLQANTEQEIMLEQIRLPESKEQGDVPEQRTDTVRSEVQFRSRLEGELTPTLGTTTGAYVGSPLHSYQRILWKRGDAAQAGVLLEKDPGEARISDFTAYHLAFSGIGPLSKVVLGDYTIEEGEGLSLSRGYGLSKGSDVVRPVMRARSGIVPYLSSDEIHYLNGLALECRGHAVVAALFLSRRTYSARLNPAGDALSISTNTTLQTSAAQDLRDNVTERLVGSRITVHVAEHCRAGIGVLTARFSRPLVIAGDRPPQTSDVAVSGDYSVAFGGMASQGEVTVRKGSAGWISTLLASLTDRCRFVLSLRAYPPSMFSLHASGFGESGNTRNERGVYCGLACSPGRTTHISVYYDQYAAFVPQSPFFFVERGTDLMVTLACVPAHRLAVDLRFRTGTGDESSASVSDVVRRTEYRLALRHAVSATVDLSARFMLLVRERRVARKEEWGRLFHAEIRSTPLRAAEMSFRVTFFHMDSFDVRLYESERGPDGTLSMPMVYGSGIRWYVFLRYRPAAWMAWCAKYSDLVRDDVRRIGSGLNQLPSNHDGRMAVQADLML